MNLTYQNYNPQFGALHIAKSGKLDLYRLTDSVDFKFIRELQKHTKTENLMPNLSTEEYSRWNEMLEYAVDNSMKKENTTYIETYNNKPCGIITFNLGKTTALDCICTWPAEFGRKVKFAGKFLFYQMFKDVEQIKGKKIKLDAITNGPFDTIKKYSTLGFKATSNVYPTKTEMEITSPKIKETVSELDKLVPYKKVPPQKINLFEQL